MLFLYDLIIHLLLPVLLLRLWYKGCKNRAYRMRILERLGFINTNLEFKSRKSIWFHAVSVGEVMAAEPLIRAAKLRFPEYNIVVTTVTPTGSLQVQKLFQDSVFHVYLPFDLSWAIRRLIKKINPNILVILETELWPNLLHHVHNASVPIIIANATISPGSFIKYEKIKFLMQKFLAYITLILAQSEQDALYYMELGCDKNSVIVAGNIKYALTIRDTERAKGAELKGRFINMPLILAASTHTGEEELVLAAFAKLKVSQPKAILLLAPRHPERFQLVFDLICAQGFKCWRHSMENNTGTPDVYLIDTLGELRALYFAADIAFIGGSLVKVGGHNVLEAAAAAIPILIGQHYYKTRAVVDSLLKREAIKVVRDQDELAHMLLYFLNLPDQGKGMGARAFKLLSENKNIITDTMMHIEKLMTHG